MATQMSVWDEPEGAASPRGWFKAGGTCTGFYLDYGPDSNRNGHKTDVGGGRIVSFCKPHDLCCECEPGDILCVRYPGGPGTASTSRHVETVDEARRFVETGSV